MSEPEHIVLELLRGIRSEMASFRDETRQEFANVRSEMKSLRADVASDLVTMQAQNDVEHKHTRDQIVGLRRAVVEYHSAVIGHGMIISELEARVRRLEQHVNLPDFDKH